MSGQKLCPNCNSVQVIAVVDHQREREPGFGCLECGAEWWPVFPPIDLPAVEFPETDPIRGGLLT
jgi:hypothetical protein